MRAIVLNGPAAARDLKFSDCPVPAVKPGWVLVKIRAFGLNHSEQLLRLSEINAPYINKPIIPGIECAGEIADASDTSFYPGQKVIALMGGMGRSFHGSYAEYALLPAHHVFSVKSSLSWERLAAAAETYYTAWGSLFQGLLLEPGDELLVRGGTCALGYAAIQLAKALGCKVTASTHRKSKLPLLLQSGADTVLLDRGVLTDMVPGVTKALELVGPNTLADTLQCMAPGGIVCSTGILGGETRLRGLDPIKDIPNGVYLTGFYSNAPDQETIDRLFAYLHTHNLSPCIGRVYPFPQLSQACQAMEDRSVNGKIVITEED